MQIFTKPEEIRAQCAAWHAAGEDIALVPTMGYYHAGHESLMEYGRSHARRLVVSLFVNPAQFGPNEDLAAYPRDFERDRAIAEAHGADALFAPGPAEMYAADHGTWVEVPEMGKLLCGRSRPIHFRGVCTVVLKLFLLTGADIAIFGQKDWQQQAILKRMTRDLNVPTRIVALPIAREPDGLALSSRNVYLSPEERKAAPNIRKGLLLAREMAANGEKSAENLRQAVLDFWKEAIPQGEVDYLEIVHPDTLASLSETGDQALMVCAVRLGKARLIDNISLCQ